MGHKIEVFSSLPDPMAAGASRWRSVATVRSRRVAQSKEAEPAVTIERVIGVEARSRRVAGVQYRDALLH